MDGSADDHPRFWAGKDYTKRNEAPFRVYQDGRVFAKKGEIGDFIIGQSGLYASDEVIQGSVYGNPKGLWLNAYGSCRVVDSTATRFGLFSCQQDQLLDLRISHTYEKFIKCRFSGGGSSRLFEISAKQGRGDESWYRRWFIRVSHFPFRNHIPPGYVDNHMDPGDYQLMWNAETGYIYVR